MKCPICGCDENQVVDTRNVDNENAVKRRRECANCHTRFTTYETCEFATPTVCKRDNTREPFDRKKAMNGLMQACRKRPVSIRQMEELITKIENECSMNPKVEISTAEIGEKLMRGLRKLDGVAYIRFASVYKKFDDVDSFINEIEKMRNEPD